MKFNKREKPLGGRTLNEFGKPVIPGNPTRVHQQEGKKKD